LQRPNVVQRVFIGLLQRKARAIGQSSHKIWTLKYILDTYLNDRQNISVLDCGAWNGWLLSYQSPSISHKVALDFDSHFARDMLNEGISFVQADMEKGCFPFSSASFDLVTITSTIEHLFSPEQVAHEIHRVLRPNGIVFITTPNILKYRFHFWDDITHKRPFTPGSLKFLFETHSFETVDLVSYNHNLFIAGNLFPRAIHRLIMQFRGKAILYVGKKPQRQGNL